MDLQLTPSLAAKLDAIPERGMGYHVVDVILHDGRTIHNVVILTGAIAVIPNGTGTLSSADIADFQWSHQ